MLVSLILHTHGFKMLCSIIWAQIYYKYSDPPSHMRTHLHIFPFLKALYRFFFVHLQCIVKSDPRLFVEKNTVHQIIMHLNIFCVKLQASFQTFLCRWPWKVTQVIPGKNWDVRNVCQELIWTTSNNSIYSLLLLLLVIKRYRAS